MQGKPEPVPNADTGAFWHACNQEKLTYQKCVHCGAVQFYPRSFCVKCQSLQLGWEVSAGRGVIHTFTINYRAPTEAFKEDGPYVIALVDFDEGFRMMMNVKDCSLEELAIGMRVKIVYEPRGNATQQNIPQAVPEDK